MKKITIILNEEKIVLHNQLHSTSCSGTISSAMNLIIGLKYHYDIDVYHRGNECLIDTISYHNISTLNDFNQSNSIAIFVGSAGVLINEHSLKFTKSYYWLHNYERLTEKNKLIKEKKLTGIICVSKYQMFTMIKSGVFFKSTYIHNIFNFKKSIDIVFSGALKKEKGIHNLFFLWHELKKVKSNVKLHIIGSSAIYNDSVNSTGISKVMDKELENEFIHLITDSNNNIDKRIIFYGLKNKKELLPIISNCDYFISGLNENGPAECFSIAFLEAQNCNIPVLTLSRGGQPESIIISGSKSFVSTKKLIDYILKIDLKKKKLSSDYIINEWIELFENKNKVHIKRIEAIYSGIKILVSKIVSKLL
ncbi:glycosyltransferase [Moellerella wisconsensis]|uniref:glycosyltransferase n=1 Tax=Moellerella wisconsensis TaxID=158849 RepID=UPI001F4DFF3B|nr:glycosyltransferase [Moellerella wisconsensis]UNH23491.1 glycosyltransferase [Moellerella wisconsensis]